MTVTVKHANGSMYPVPWNLKFLVYLACFIPDFTENSWGEENKFCRLNPFHCFRKTFCLGENRTFDLRFFILFDLMVIFVLYTCLICV